MFEDIHIRRFSFSDLPRILEIEHASFTVDAFSEDTFRRWYNKCPELFTVAEISGLIVGYMSSCILPEKGDIVSIAVDPLYRRKGVGRALVNYTLKEMASARVQVVELEVRKTNTEAIRFWESFGFFPVRIIPNFYRDGAEALQMRKFLA